MQFYAAQECLSRKGGSFGLIKLLANVVVLRETLTSSFVIWILREREFLRDDIKKKLHFEQALVLIRSPLAPSYVDAMIPPPDGFYESRICPNMIHWYEKRLLANLCCSNTTTTLGYLEKFEDATFCP